MAQSTKVVRLNRSLLNMVHTAAREVNPDISLREAVEWAIAHAGDIEWHRQRADSFSELLKAADDIARMYESLARRLMKSHERQAARTSEIAEEIAQDARTDFELTVAKAEERADRPIDVRRRPL